MFQSYKTCKKERITIIIISVPYTKFPNNFVQQTFPALVLAGAVCTIFMHKYNSNIYHSSTYNILILWLMYSTIRISQRSVPSTGKTKMKSCYMCKILIKHFNNNNFLNLGINSSMQKKKQSLSCFNYVPCAIKSDCTGSALQNMMKKV